MIFNNVLNFIFPQQCCICNKIGLPICSKCSKLIKSYEINLIENKILKMEKVNENGKKELIKLKKIFIYKYDGIVRNLLINYKFNDASYLADTFAYLIKNNKKIYDILKTYDIILPVPLHRKRKLERGYNQTELIVRRLGFKYEKECLVKIKNTKPQSTNNAKARKVEEKDAFKIRNIEKIKNKKVLIFDDIYTTGATAKECVKTVSIATNKIGFISIARDYMKYF